MDPVLSSIFFLTLLLAVGLGFFLRASTKDRTEQAEFLTPWDQAVLLEKLKQYFAARSYQVTAVDPDQGRISLIGIVQASWVLAAFLSLLAAIGLGSIALVLALTFPQGGWGFAGLVLLSPLVGLFYWRGATRPETVSFQMAALEDTALEAETRLWVSAHRDEMATLQSQLGLKRTEAELD